MGFPTDSRAEEIVATLCPAESALPRNGCGSSLPLGGFQQALADATGARAELRLARPWWCLEERFPEKNECSHQAPVVGKTYTEIGAARRAKYLEHTWQTVFVELHVRARCGSPFDKVCRRR